MVKFLSLDGLAKLIDNIKYDFIQKNDIVDNCDSISTVQPLSANQGTILQNQITEINNLLNSNGSGSSELIATYEEVSKHLEIGGIYGN